MLQLKLIYRHIYEDMNIFDIMTFATKITLHVNISHVLMFVTPDKVI